MADVSPQAIIPRWFLAGAMALVVATVVVAGVGRVTGYGVSRISDAPVAHSVDIRFAEQANGGMLVLRHEDDAALAVLASDGGGFVRGIVRSLFRQRLLAGADKALPFQLVRRTDGKYFIADPVLDSRIALDGFGPSNTRAVAELLEAGLASKEKSAVFKIFNETSLDARHTLTPVLSTTEGRTE
jgi:putative photosynthetic complex assembly protein